MWEPKSGNRKVAIVAEIDSAVEVVVQKVNLQKVMLTLSVEIAR